MVIQIVIFRTLWKAVLQFNLCMAKLLMLVFIEGKKEKFIFNNKKEPLSRLLSGKSTSVVPGVLSCQLEIPSVASPFEG